MSCPVGETCRCYLHVLRLRRVGGLLGDVSWSVGRFVTFTFQWEDKGRWGEVKEKVGPTQQ